MKDFLMNYFDYDVQIIEIGDNQCIINLTKSSHTSNTIHKVDIDCLIVQSSTHDIKTLIPFRTISRIITD